MDMAQGYFLMLAEQPRRPERPARSRTARRTRMPRLSRLWTRRHATGGTASPETHAPAA